MLCNNFKIINMRNSFSIKTICIVSIILLSVGCSLANSGKQNKPSPKGKKEVIQINPDKLIPYPDFPIQKFLAMQEKLDKGNVGEAEAKLLVDSIDKAVLYDIIYSEGCSWYCGGSYKSLTSSSCQKNTIWRTSLCALPRRNSLSLPMPSNMVL